MSEQEAGVTPDGVQHLDGGDRQVESSADALLGAATAHLTSYLDELRARKDAAISGAFQIQVPSFRVALLEAEGKQNTEEYRRARDEKEEQDSLKLQKQYEPDYEDFNDGFFGVVKFWRPDPSGFGKKGPEPTFLEAVAPTVIPTGNENVDKAKLNLKAVEAMKTAAGII